MIAFPHFRMKTKIRNLTALLTAMVFTGVCFTTSAYAPQPVVNAEQRGWLAAAGISPEAPMDRIVTYEQLIIMVCEATGIKPGSSIDALLAHTDGALLAEPKYAYMAFQDALDAAVNQKGYLKTATQFGLLILSDYEDDPNGGYVDGAQGKIACKKLDPYRPALRSDAVMLIARALGKKYDAEMFRLTYEPFSDWDTVPNWMKGYVGTLTDIGILAHGMEGGVRVHDAVTLEELCTLLCHTFDFMRQGINEETCVVFSMQGTKKGSLRAYLPAPAQGIGELIYVPVRAVYQTAYDLLDNRPFPARFYEGVWNKFEQSISFNWGGRTLKYTAGQTYYEQSPDPNWLPGYARMLNGEIMFPVKTFETGRWLLDDVEYCEIQLP